MKKTWNVISTVLVVVVVILALLLVGARILGLQVYTVLSGSMEPTYHVGSVIYVKPIDTDKITVGMPITFVLDESGTVATHRVVEIVPDADNPSEIRFRTAGDANKDADGEQIIDENLVHYKNVIGTPIFTIPLLGYVSDFVQHSPGNIIAICGGILVILMIFLPDLVPKEKEKKEETPKESSEE